MSLLESLASVLGPRAPETAPHENGDGAPNGAHPFDEAARVLASGLPRREALKLAALTLAAGALSNVGIRPAWASHVCKCNGRILPPGWACCEFRKRRVLRRKPYDVTQHCCTRKGLVSKWPIRNFKQCPFPAPHPGHIPSPNALGPSGENGVGTPDNWRGANWRICKDRHNLCYDTCLLGGQIDAQGNIDGHLRIHDARAFCDLEFLSCLLSECQAHHEGPTLDFCAIAAKGYYGGVHQIGLPYFKLLQAHACDCCPGDEPCCTEDKVCGNNGLCCDQGEVCDDNECVPGGGGGDGGAFCPPGSSCFGQFFFCAGGQCVCFDSVEGNPFCHRGQSCAGSQSCTSSAQCPPEFTCSDVTCCGLGVGICAQPCFFGGNEDKRGRKKQPKGVRGPGTTVG